MTSKPHWKPEEIEKLLKLFHKGHRSRSISNQLPGRSPESVSRKLNRLGYRFITPWKQDEINYAKKLRSHGLTYEQIGKLIGRSRMAVFHKLYKSPETQWKKSNTQITIPTTKTGNIIKFSLLEIVESKLKKTNYEYGNLPVGVDKDDIDLAIEYGEWRVL